MAAILVLLAVLYISYRQTIEAYPNNGGSYIVAKENLGANAACSPQRLDDRLCPQCRRRNFGWHRGADFGSSVAAPVDLELCLSVLALITVVNLRGTLEAGLAFSVPTYLFVASLGVVCFGVVKTLAAGGSPVPVVPPPPLPPGETVTLWLLLRAFASGCTAMTGVEAVSNGVSAFGIRQ